MTHLPLDPPLATQLTELAGRNLLTVVRTLDPQILATTIAVAHLTQLARDLRGTTKTGTALVSEPVASLIAVSPDHSLVAAHSILGKVMGAHPDDRRVLLTTLRTWFQVGGRTAQAARLLYCHRNTVRSRLHRLEELTGRSLADPRDIAELLIAVETLRLLEPRPHTTRRTP